MNKGQCLHKQKCNTYVQSWLKLTKKTRLWGSVVWFARFISPDILYFSPCVNTSTLCTRFCINRTDGLRKNTLSASFLISFYIFFSLYFYCLFFYLFLFFLVHTLIQIHARARLYKICEQMSNSMSTIPTSDYMMQYTVLLNTYPSFHVSNSWQSMLNSRNDETETSNSI